MVLKLAWANVRRSYKDFAIYFVTLLVGVAVFYAFNSIEAQQGVLALNRAQGQMIELLGVLIGIVSVLITAIMAFLVVYANRFLVRRRNKEFGLYLLLGMTRGTMLRLMAAETLLVGFASLAIGLALGVGVSQALVWVTATLFSANMNDTFAFLFVPDVALRTVAVFCGIFALSLLLNVGCLMRAKLVDLINADRKNETLTLRSVPLSLVLFAIACMCIGLAYHLLLENGLLTSDSSFWTSTALVCVGTVLFFYSLSGFLLRVMQLATPLYYRGLNMFVLREVASRVNSTFASMSVICLTLFLAITSVCGGIGICNAMNNGYRDGYDATVRTYYSIETSAPVGTAASMNDELAKSSEAVGGVDWGSMVREATQVDFYHTDLTMDDFDALAPQRLGDMSASVERDYGSVSVSAVKLSQFNRALEMEGMAPVSLESGCALIASDFEMLDDYYRGVAASGGEVAPFGKALKLASQPCFEPIETTSTGMNAGVVVLNDEEVPATALVTSSLLDINYAHAGVETPMEDALSKISDDQSAFDISMYQTKQQVHDQGVGLTTVVSYLAIYIGFVLVVACAAILAIQQLTAASDNRKRYALLAKLGATQGMLDGALFKQIAIAFLFPLSLAVCHSACAMIAVTDVVQMFGHIEIGQVAALASAAFLVVYCAYFALTFFQARGLVHAGLRG